MADVIKRSNGEDNIRFINPKSGHSWVILEFITRTVKKRVESAIDVNSWQQVKCIAINVIKSNPLQLRAMDRIYGSVEIAADLIVDIMKLESEVIFESEQLEK